jgi:HAD superfamily hydrolase (TIGR01450 family)
VTAQTGAALRGTGCRLLDEHDGLLLDLDGVCYVGEGPVPAAPQALAAARDAGIAIRFITNNASRTAASIAAKLRAVGIESHDGEILTSAACAAGVLAGELPRGAAVLVVGGAGLVEAVRDVALRPVRSAEDGPAAVVQGWDRGVDWQQLAEATIAVRRGIPWTATNLDLTIPDDRGILPGNGSLVALVASVTNTRPRVIGKPEPLMYAAAADGLTRPLGIGDRLDTDIAGANRAGIPSLFVLSGVGTPLDLMQAPADQRPTYLGRDLAAVTATHPVVCVAEAQASCGEAVARWDGEELRVEGSGGPDGLDRLRAACGAVWTRPSSPALTLQGIKGLDLL